MTDEIKEAVVFMSEAMESLLNLCDEHIDAGSDEAAAIKEIRAAKEHYDGVLRAAKVLPIPEAKDEDLFEGGSRPMDLVSLAETMSAAPNADVHQDGQ